MKTILSWGESKCLAKCVSRKTGYELIVPAVTKFANGETKLHLETIPKTSDIVIVATFEKHPNRKIFEILLVLDALSRLGKHKITLAAPWFPYSPQDKVFRTGEALSSKVVINLLESMGVSKFVVIDIHSRKLLPMFTQKIINIDPVKFYAKYIKQNMQVNKDNWKVAILDKGNTQKSNILAKSLGLDKVKFKKFRSRSTGKVTFKSLEGDVEGFSIVACDDYISTGGTLLQSAEYLKKKGANKYICFVTHVVVPQTLEKIADSEIDELYLSNSFVNLESSWGEKVKLLDISELLAGEL